MDGAVTVRFLSVFLVLGFLVPSHDNSLAAQSAGRTAGALGQLSNSFEELTSRVSPAVVQIFASGYSSGATESVLLSKRQSGGTGVILNPEGYIVTNAHVVEGARQIEVLLPTTSSSIPEARSILKPRSETVEAQIAGIDRETDLAILKIDGGELPFLQLGDSDQTRQGQLVLAFGSPRGLENSVTLGIVSAVARQLRPEDPVVYVQTDAPINPGNSGGPLVDAKGNVIGINTLILSQSGGSEGLGFAVPSNIVKNVFEQIRVSGQVRRAEVGVFAQTVTPALARGLGLPQDWGVVLGDVFPSGPADLTGLRVGDLVLTLDGKIMENGRQFDVNLYRRAVGGLVTLEVLRDSRKLAFNVRTIERADDYSHLARLVDQTNLIPQLGILGIDIDSQVAQLLPAPRKLGGMLVASNSANLGYWRDDFAPGDVIYAINGEEVIGLEKLRTILAELKDGESVVVQVQRQSRLRYITVEVE